MGEILDAWCGGRTKSGATVSGLGDALDEAKLGFQARAVRHMVGMAGNDAGGVEFHGWTVLNKVSMFDV